MLNKDQYNEDIYNDVYAQATRGAEIKHSKTKRGKSKLVLILLLLALIGTVGYFVWQNLNPIKETTTTSIETTPLVEAKEESLEEALQKTLEASEKETVTTTENTTNNNSSTADIVVNIASKTGDGKMSPTDIARIVQLVTQQMQAEKKVEDEKLLESTKVKDSLEASLENVETDTLFYEKIVVDSIDGSQKKEATIDTKTNTYNKIVLKKSDTNNNLTDELTQLSMEISNVIDSDNDDITDTTSSTYTSSLSQEANTRSKEMRYHIVKKGDTLAGIALKIYGSTQDYIKLYDANPDILRRADKIYIGQRLRIP